MTDIIPVQIKLIHILKSQLKMGEEEYRALLREFDAASSKELSYEGASSLIDELKKRGGIITPRPKGEGDAKRRVRAPKGPNIIPLASKEQRWKINDLADRIFWRAPQGYERWLKKRFGLERVKTAGEAWKVIEGLKGLLKGQAAPSSPTGPTGLTGPTQSKEEPF